MRPSTLNLESWALLVISRFTMDGDAPSVPEAIKDPLVCHGFQQGTVSVLHVADSLAHIPSAKIPPSAPEDDHRPLVYVLHSQQRQTVDEIADSLPPEQKLLQVLF